jgi:hypothetical protein
LAEFFRVQVARHLRTSSAATCFIGCDTLASVGWSAVAGWFPSQRIHAADHNPD